MTTTLRRETAPRHAPIERIVVGPTLFTAIADPTEPLHPNAGVRYVFPDAGTAPLGAAVCPDEILDLVERGIQERQPDAIWLRDLPWFTETWGVRAAGRMERLLSEMVAGTDLEFVSWLEGSSWLRGNVAGTRRYALSWRRTVRAARPTARSR